MKKIAIIDDDIHIGDMLTEVLTQEGYGVLRACSGTEALYLLSQNKPDLVLLDLMLPGLSGEEVLPHIENIPVIRFPVYYNGTVIDDISWENESTVETVALLGRKVIHE